MCVFCAHCVHIVCVLCACPSIIIAHELAWPYRSILLLWPVTVDVFCLHIGSLEIYLALNKLEVPRINALRTHSPATALVHQWNHPFHRPCAPTSVKRGLMWKQKRPTITGIPEVGPRHMPIACISHMSRQTHIHTHARTHTHTHNTRECIHARMTGIWIDMYELRIGLTLVRFSTYIERYRVHEREREREIHLHTCA